MIISAACAPGTMMAAFFCYMAGNPAESLGAVPKRSCRRIINSRSRTRRNDRRSIWVVLHDSAGLAKHCYASGSDTRRGQANAPPPPPDDTSARIHMHMPTRTHGGGGGEAWLARGGGGGQSPFPRPPVRKVSGTGPRERRINPQHKNQYQRRLSVEKKLDTRKVTQGSHKGYPPPTIGQPHAHVIYVRIRAYMYTRRIREVYADTYNR